MTFNLNKFMTENVHAEHRALTKRKAELVKELSEVCRLIGEFEAHIAINEALNPHTVVKSVTPIMENIENGQAL